MFVAILLTLCSSAFARLETSHEIHNQTRWVVHAINSGHYLRDSIHQLDGRKIIEKYVKSLDYRHMYFLREEINEFCFRFGDSMEGFLKKGNLYAAFEIYRSFKQKAIDYSHWVNQRLDEDFDFSTDETFTPNRREADWPVSEEEIENLRERQLKYELLNEILSIASVSSSVAEDENIDEKKENKPFDPQEISRLIENPKFLETTLEEARKKIGRRYERNLRRVQDSTAIEVQEIYINAMTQLFDPHSTFLSSDTLASFTSSIQNSFLGIGAMLEDDDGICTIKEIIPGGPAETSQALQPKDQILGVAQENDDAFEDVIDMQLDRIVKKIKGPKNTVVRLLIRPGNALDPSVRKEVSIVRDEFKITANLATAKLIDVPSENRNIQVGVIELPTFYGNIETNDTPMNATQDIAELLDKLRNAGSEGIIIDLRKNRGGLLSEAVRMAGLFIPVGPVVQVRDKNGRTEVLRDHDPRVLWNGPLIILTSRYSASASEIVAGALQDYGRALIVGDSSTHGKGTVQEIHNMKTKSRLSQIAGIKPASRPVAIKLTTRQFYLPGDGSSTQLKGVASDIIVPSANEFLHSGESDLPNALPWNQIKGLRLSSSSSRPNINLVQQEGLKETLLAASKKRQEDLEEFQFLEKQIAWRKQRFDEKEISINLEERIQNNIRELSYIETLNETYENLSKDNYSTRKFLTMISEELRGTPSSQSDKEENAQNNDVAIVNSPEDEKEDKPPYDIHLRESARIMADWIRFSEANPSTMKTSSYVIDRNKNGNGHGNPASIRQ